MISIRSPTAMRVLRDVCFFFFQAEDGIRDLTVTGVQTCALPIYGEQVVVPGRGAGGVVAASPPAAGSSPSAPLDLNSATLEQLENLPGIGPVTAQKILDYRQAHGAFHAVAELEGVPGIGPAHMAQLKGLVIP